MLEKKHFSPLKQGLLAITLFGTLILPNSSAIAQSINRGTDNTMTVRSDVQEANSETGVITARGNVQINYPVQELQATAAQAQYFRKERRLVLTGDVYVLQGENSIRAEKVTYLLEEGRFVATPKDEQQVTSTYVVPQPQQNNTTSSPQ
ncbi:OstA family protein [Halothece sp. PCC 7418]|uniref:LptA/OstA family protein n=1 Tax=Halothece sp. (strain PCC 7418) TaxID=65093 RepID=UPI0002A0722F|nr:LptA/OstA family protein [Halothece sp. PCC 7418]AFZ42394.1 OstA family protein [Halothece sp. PCC 7418]